MTNTVFNVEKYTELWQACKVQSNLLPELEKIAEKLHYDRGFYEKIEWYYPNLPWYWATCQMGKLFGIIYSVHLGSSGLGLSVVKDASQRQGAKGHWDLGIGAGSGLVEVRH